MAIKPVRNERAAICAAVAFGIMQSDIQRHNCFVHISFQMQTTAPAAAAAACSGSSSSSSSSGHELSESTPPPLARERRRQGGDRKENEKTVVSALWPLAPSSGSRQHTDGIGFHAIREYFFQLVGTEFREVRCSSRGLRSLKPKFKIKTRLEPNRVVGPPAAMARRLNHPTARVSCPSFWLIRHTFHHCSTFAVSKSTTAPPTAVPLQPLLPLPPCLRLQPASPLQPHALRAKWPLNNLVSLMHRSTRSFASLDRLVA